MKRELDYKLIFKRILLVMMDILSVVFSCFFALATRFEFVVSAIPQEHMSTMLKFLPMFIILNIFWLYVFRIYYSLWEYAGLQEALNIIYACVAAGIAQFGFVIIFGAGLPRSFYLLVVIYQMFFVGATRFWYRYIRMTMQNRTFPWKEKKNKKRIMLIGAGEAGNVLLSEMQNSKYLHDEICCIIDDDPSKMGRFLRGVRVVGNRYDIKRYVNKYNIDEIVIAMPSASTAEVKAILEICKETECEMKMLPGIYQLMNGEINVSKLRPVSIEDLLGREEVKVNLDDIMHYVSNKVVLVSGGGGSIGSELCRQIANYKPKQLIIFDIYENNAYDIQQELHRNHPELDVVALIGSVRDERRLNSVFGTYRPEIVYHAAAHKHVPLMETSPNEAIKNNVLGTYKIVKMADAWGVERFVQISTDKAVNPTNIMGATKRICEMIIQSYNEQSKTDYVAVRFGNVLGSNGSVIPLFKKQIENGGPVTVTHENIIRYFMTIPEAVSLVLQAGSYAKGGEIFVLDMGEPVRIMDLAKNMIRLSGLTLGKDIEIKITGLRPGEKLFEELLMDEEGMTETPNKQIYIGHPIDVDKDKLYYALQVMEDAVDNEVDDVRDIVESIVPTYHPKK